MHASLFRITISAVKYYNNVQNAMQCSMMCLKIRRQLDTVNALLAPHPNVFFNVWKLLGELSVQNNNTFSA